MHGQDKINLARIDPDSGHSGDQAFHWLGHSALGTTPGDLSWFSSGGNTIVQGSTDTDTAAEFWLQLNGNVGPKLGGDGLHSCRCNGHASRAVTASFPASPPSGCAVTALGRANGARTNLELGCGRCSLPEACAALPWVMLRDVSCS